MRAREDCATSGLPSYGKTGASLFCLERKQKAVNKHVGEQVGNKRSCGHRAEQQNSTHTHTITDRNANHSLINGEPNPFVSPRAASSTIHSTTVIN